MLRRGLLTSFGLCIAVSATIAAANDPLVIVVERSDWLPEARKIACRETSFRVWCSGNPQWFSEFLEQETQIIVLCGASDSDREQVMWRERLAAQGCKLVGLNSDRSTGQVSASEIYERTHQALVETFPGAESTWNENFGKAMRASPALKAVRTMSSFAAFESR